MDYDLIALRKKYKKVGLSLVFLGCKEMRRLNRHWRKVDKSTSVLTFYQGRATPEGTFFLGEILISLEKAKSDGLNLNDLIQHGIQNLLSEIPTAKNLRT